MLHNDRGTTLAELLVAMGLSSLLLLIIVSGVIFMQRSIGRWLDDSRKASDIATVGEVLADHLAPARFVQSFSDSLIVVRTNGERHFLDWSSGILTLDGRAILSDGVRTTIVRVNQFSLKSTPRTPIFITEKSTYAEHSGLYQIEISWTDPAHYGAVSTRFVAEAADRFLATQLAPRDVDSLGFFSY